MRETLTDRVAVVERLPLFDAGQCASWWQDLQRLRSHWYNRGNGFFTMGASTYLDLCPPGSSALYRDRSACANAVLRRVFGGMQERVASVLTAILGKPCAFHHDLALPGFHIFTSLALRGAYRDSLHIDLQHQYLPLESNVLTATLTFTLPLVMPAQGAGIEFCQPASSKKANIRLERYALGELFIHSGRVLHRRAHFPASSICDRVTLQGHGIEVNGTWILYW